MIFFFKLNKNREPHLEYATDSQNWSILNAFPPVCQVIVFKFNSKQHTCNFDLVSSEIDSTVYDWIEIRRLLKYHMLIPSVSIPFSHFFFHKTAYSGEYSGSDEERQRERDR